MENFFYTFVFGCRLNQIIFRGENVLVPGVVEQMLEVSRRVRAIRTPSNRTWEDLCFRLV